MPSGLNATPLTVLVWPVSWLRDVASWALLLRTAGLDCRVNAEADGDDEQDGQQADAAAVTGQALVVGAVAEPDELRKLGT